MIQAGHKLLQISKSLRGTNWRTEALIAMELNVEGLLKDGKFFACEQVTESRVAKCDGLRRCRPRQRSPDPVWATRRLTS